MSSGGKAPLAWRRRARRNPNRIDAPHGENRPRERFQLDYKLQIM
jgi:hypothetical protein